MKWCVEKGLVVTKIHSAIKATPNAPFKDFRAWVQSEREKGDVDAKYKVKGDNAKLDGNSAVGKDITNKNKQTTFTYVNSFEKLSSEFNSPMFKNDTLIDKDCWEVEKFKAKVRQDLAVHIGVAVYNLAKLKMLQFVHDFLYKYFDREKLQLIQMDTDSMYLALTEEKLEDILKPAMKEDYEREKNKWLVTKKEDRRIPGLFKEEFKGEGMVALCSKMYYVKGLTPGKNKLSCKGVSKKTNNLSFENYKNVLISGKPISAVNKGFRMLADNRMHTYSVSKKGISPIYPKRRVLSDGVSTEPLAI